MRPMGHDALLQIQSMTRGMQGMSAREVDRRLGHILSGRADGAPRCVCGHNYFAHEAAGENTRACDWCGCNAFRARAGQVRLTGAWVAP